MHKLPSINLLKSFDAAARHLSFKKAADELCVSPSAVGHQIRVLEEFLNILLFKRLNRAIELTEQGRKYHQEISAALQTLDRATHSLIEQHKHESLVIHSFPFLTNVLLVPHIKSFKARHKNIHIGIESKTERTVFSHERLEVALRHSKPDNPDLYSEEILAVTVSPVCAPSYLQQTDRTQIQLSVGQGDWHKWQSEWQLPFEFNNVLHCNSMQAAIELAEQGLGVAMGYFPALKMQVRSKKLVLVDKSKLSKLDSIYLVFHKKHKDHPIILSFASWIKSISTQFSEY